MESVPQSSPASVSTSGSCSSQNLASEYQQTSLSPGSVEVSSDTGNHTIESNGVDGHFEILETKGSNEPDVSQALRRIEEQLSLNEDSLKDIDSFYRQDEGSNSNLVDFYEMSNEDQFSVLQHPENAIHDNNYTSFEMQGNNMISSIFYMENCGEVINDQIACWSPVESEAFNFFYYAEVAFLCCILLMKQNDLWLLLE